MSKPQFEILPFCEAFYIDSMQFLTESALRSVAAANRILDKATEPTGPDASQLLNHLQNVVLQGATLSRYFWPVRKGHEDRGDALCKALNVTDASPLKSRELRNEIEHFDEKLDAYLAGGIFGIILPSYIGAMPDEGGVTAHVFRAFYTDKAVFEILGKRFEVNPMVDEIARIHGLLDKAQSSGGRFT